MHIGIFCRKDQASKKGDLPIIFYVNQKKIPTGETCRAGSWDDAKSVVKSKFNGSEFINKRLAKKKLALAAIIEANKEFDIDRIRKLFKQYLKNPDAMDKVMSTPTSGMQSGEFFILIDSLLMEYRTVWSEGYKKRFKTIRTKFLDYDPSFTIDKLAPGWWRGFVDHCIEEWGNENNTINTDAKVIQRLIDVLRDKGHKLPPELDQITWKYIEPEIMSITWDDVQKIVDVDLSNPIRATMPDSRTLWLIGAYTGRRWNEIERMSEKNFYKDQKGRWRYKSVGKGLKPIDIPLLPEAVAFLKKIKFTLPTLVQQTVNKDIKDIARAAKLTNKVLVRTIKGKDISEELVEEWKTIHIHTGRHTYAMRIVDMSAGQAHSEKFVSFMLGHASHATTWKYLNRRVSSHDKMFDEIFTKD